MDVRPQLDESALFKVFKGLRVFYWLLNVSISVDHLKISLFLCQTNWKWVAAKLLPISLPHKVSKNFSYFGLKLPQIFLFEFSPLSQSIFNAGFILLLAAGIKRYFFFGSPAYF